MVSKQVRTNLRDCPFQESICKAGDCMLWIRSDADDESETGHCSIVKSYNSTEEIRNCMIFGFILVIFILALMFLLKP
ncbi:MAG: hypothetical protein P1Q69_18655 [Candidatus Thorarchaeota archaeon]|nr:hypothetical protein [Candidatus Thorarchaeota archaeon]